MTTTQSPGLTTVSGTTINQLGEYEPAMVGDTVGDSIDGKRLPIYGTAKAIIGDEFRKEFSFHSKDNKKGTDCPKGFVDIKDNEIFVNPVNDKDKLNPNWGTTRAIISNIVIGVSKGFNKTLELLLKVSPNGIDTYILPILQTWAAAGSNQQTGGLQIIKDQAERGVLEPIYDYHSALINEFIGNSEAAKINYSNIIKKSNNANAQEFY